MSFFLFLTIVFPRDEATGAMRHVERASRVRQTLRGHDAQHGGHAALERELDLRLMGVAGGE